LWIVGIACWIALSYVMLPGLMHGENKPKPEQGLNGAWLLVVVGTQAISVLGCALVPSAFAASPAVPLFAALSFWLVGSMIYIWLIALIFHRIVFLPLQPGELTPPYWINMGAMAISTLAGALLIRDAAQAPFLASLEPFLKGFTVFYWASGSWWIPLLVVLAFWRYVWRRFPLKYDPLYWGAVFPLGMYAAATEEMIGTMHLEFLQWLPQLFAYLALIAWAMAFAGFALDVLRRSRAAVRA